MKNRILSILFMGILLIGCTDSTVDVQKKSAVTAATPVYSSSLYYYSLLNPNNSINITFTEVPVSASGTDLTKDAFDVTITGGTASLGTSWSLTKLTATNYQINLDLQGSSDGSEVVMLLAKDNMIFDSLGIVAFNAPSMVKLIDMAMPTYSTNILGNKTIQLSFSEPVINFSLQDLIKTDLAVTIVGGAATLGAAWSMVKVSELEYNIDLDLQGTPTGSELVHINMNSNSVFDEGRNLVLSTDEIETLPDEAVPTFSINVETNNFVTITFSEDISDETNTDLDLADFGVSIIGGVATQGASASLAKTSASVNEIGRAHV